MKKTFLALIAFTLAALGAVAQPITENKQETPEVPGHRFNTATFTAAPSLAAFGGQRKGIACAGGSDAHGVLGQGYERPVAGVILLIRIISCLS